MNYTLTNFADHTEDMSHDAINRYLRGDQVIGSAMWHNLRDEMVPSPNGYIVFADTFADKNFSHQIGLVQRQYRVYRIKQGLLDDYLCQQLKNPTIPMQFAEVLLNSLCTTISLLKKIGLAFHTYAPITRNEFH